MASAPAGYNSAGRGLAVAALLFGALVCCSQAIAPTAASAAPAGSAAYVSVQPCRLADTRVGGGFSRLDPLTVQISARNVCGLPANATSLVLTLTVAGPQGPGFLTAWPADQARPTVSNLNFTRGQVRANGAITRVDSSGSFRVFTSVASNVVVDVVGAFVPASTASAGRFVPRAPTRLFDSRPGPALPPGGSTIVPLPAGIPADVVGLALNITLTESTGPGFVTAFPAGRQMPTASVLNVDAAGQTRAAAGIIPVSAAGVAVYVSGGGHIVVDVQGYFTGPSAGSSSTGLFTAYDPTRLLDTRGPSPLGTAVPLYPAGGLEVGATSGGSMAYNVTSVEGDVGFVTGYPAGTPVPTTSSVNSMGRIDTVANFGITQVSNRGLGFFSQSQTHLVLDLHGWFSGSQAVATLPPPRNTAPLLVPTYSACAHDGLSTFNATRAAVGAGPLATNAGAEAFACQWALELATAGNGISHSDSNARSVASGCPAGENVAYATGSSASQLIEMWYGSPGHLANIQNPSYVGAGIGFVIRTEPSGYTTIYGVTVLTLC